jgi:chloride channel protein, CIC family
VPAFNHPLFRKYRRLVGEDLRATYSRDIQKWLLVAPIIGVVAGLVVTGVAVAILDGTWRVILPLYMRHHWMILPGLLFGFLLTGLIMEYRTSDPNEHSTEEIIRSYHEHQGAIDMRPFWWKLLAAVTTVGFGGSAALEGPSIYGGGAIGSWLWGKLRRLGLEPHDRRIMLISGAAAGMAAVFRAPLTGIVFALEIPYKDDIAHEALLPALIASVVAYATMVPILGSEPLFAFAGSTAFSDRDLLWSALLGLICGLAAMVFAITFRRARSFAISAPIPHTLKLLSGCFGTAVCGLVFVGLFPGPLIPLGPNYEAAREILSRPHSSGTLISFAILKLAASLFSIGSGGVSAVFVPLFLAGGALGNAFAQTVVHSPTFDLYAAVGMASFIAAGYKTPLAAVVFVAETTGGHFYIIPSLIGAAIAYAVSGEASVSGDQRVHEVAALAELSGIEVRKVMQPEIAAVQAGLNLRAFAERAAADQRAIFPVYDGPRAVATVAVRDLSRIAPEKWLTTTVGDIADHHVPRVPADCPLMEALKLLGREEGEQLLFVGNDDGALEGIITKTDILRALQTRGIARVRDRVG